VATQSLLRPVCAVARQPRSSVKKKRASLTVCAQKKTRSVSRWDEPISDQRLAPARAHTHQESHRRAEDREAGMTEDRC
jgi:hypothetical protein